MNEEVCIVWQIDYDCDDGQEKKAIAVTLSDGNLSALGVAAKYIAGMNPQQHYLGADGNVYPRYCVTTQYVWRAESDKPKEAKE